MPHAFTGRKTTKSTVRGAGATPYRNGVNGERTFGLLYTITARDSSLHFSFLAERGNGSVDPTDYVRLLNMRHSSLWSADENTLLVHEHH